MLWSNRKNKETLKKDTIKPTVDYKVNKEYDEKGNLIKNDSTYTYYNINIDRNAVITHSILACKTRWLIILSLLIFLSKKAI